MSPTLHRTVTRRLVVVWLAVLVMVLGALAPTVSHALAHGGAAVGTEVCSSSGPHTISTDSPAGPESAMFLVHCPFCLLHTDRVAPPPHLLPYLFSVQDGYREPMVRQAFFYVRFFSPVPAPRGPPASF